MAARRRCLPPLGTVPCWHVTVLSADGRELIEHTACEDHKEAQCVATEARSKSQALKIYLRDPLGHVKSWD